MANDYRDELAAARAAADAAGRLALGYFRTALTVEYKADHSPVTIADRGAEEALRRTLGATFPRDGFLGEEFGESTGSSGRRWIVDPIDGTQSFIRGVPLWGVLVALEDDGECVLGVVALPALGETLWATRGGGAFVNGAPARVSAVTALADATVLTSDASAHHFGEKDGGFRRLLDRTARHRGWGDCYGYALVATGRAEIMLDPLMNPWDAAAVKPIIEEAGGCFCAWGGESTIYGGSALAVPSALRDAVLATLSA